MKIPFNYNHIIVLLLIILLGNGVVNAQMDLVITDISVNDKDLSARTSLIKDLNGEMCAVVKIQSPYPVISANGNVIGEIEPDGQQTIVHITKGTKVLQLNFQDMPSQIISFKEWGISDIGSGMSIEIRIEDIVGLDQWVLVSKGRALYEKGLHEQAISVFERLIKVADNEEAKFAGIIFLVTYYGEKKEYSKAYAICNNAPDSKYKFLTLGALLCREGKISDAISNLEKAEGMGAPEALDVLFKIYHGEIKPEYKNDNKAFAYGMKMASNGNIDAQHFVACCYLGGTGVSASLDDSIEFLTMSASRGKVESQRMLGAIYIMDSHRDLYKARRWLKMSAAQNDQESINLLNQIGWE